MSTKRSRLSSSSLYSQHDQHTPDSTAIPDSNHAPHEPTSTPDGTAAEQAATASEKPSPNLRDQREEDSSRDRTHTAERAEKSAHRANRQRQVNFRMTEDDYARVNAAFQHTRAHTGDRSQRAMLTRAILAETKRLEAEYNDSKPFPPLPAGQE